MGSSAFHNVYTEADDFSVDESDSEQADFDIASDASDADLLELKQERTNWAQRRHNETWQIPLLRLKK